MQLGLPFKPLFDYAGPHPRVARAARSGVSAGSHPRGALRAQSEGDVSSIEFRRHPRARRYTIRVSLDGGVRVTMPRWGSRREAGEFARQEYSWIEKQRRRIYEQRRRAQVLGLRVETALRETARRELPGQLSELAVKYGLAVSRVSVRNQRWRWGSCSPSGHISLNWRLIQLPPFVREYVLIHELMHLKRHDHSPKFWRLVADACPDYQVARKRLREHGDLLVG